MMRWYILNGLKYQQNSWIAIDYDGQPKTRKGLKAYKNQGLSYDDGQP